MSGVWITGHMRSGTSMVAGLFAAHGVFFGETGGPRPNNRKGNNENEWLKTELKAERIPRGWKDRLRKEGWDGESPWGFKVVAIHWDEIRHLEPSVVVLCYRPMEDILDSCERFGQGRRFSREYREPMVRKHWAIMEELEETYPGTVVPVDTPELVAGEYDQIIPAFEALGVEFNEDAANEWIDPDLFHG